MKGIVKKVEALNEEYEKVSMTCECPERSADNVFTDRGSAEGTRCRCDIGAMDDAGNVESSSRFNIDKVSITGSPRGGD